MIIIRIIEYGRIIKVAIASSENFGSEEAAKEVIGKLDTTGLVSGEFTKLKRAVKI